MTTPVEAGDWQDTIFFVVRSKVDSETWYPTYVNAPVEYVVNCGRLRRVQQFVMQQATQEVAASGFRWVARGAGTYVLQSYTIAPATPGENVPDYTEPVPEDPTESEVTPDPDPVAEPVKKKHSKWTAWMFED